MAYSHQQLMDLWVQFGGNPASADMAASIAQAESAGNPAAVNTSNSDGTTDRGLWQINSIWGGLSSNDIATNVRAAIQISNNGSNWQPWSTFNNGAYRQYVTGGRPDGGQVSLTDNMGVSAQNSSVSSYLPQAVNPILSLDALRSQDPMVAAIVTSVPELQGIFNQAVSGQWSTDKFIAAVQNSKWWATNSDTARQVFAMMKADPATYGQNITNLDAELQQTATTLGANMTQAQLNALAVDALTNGYDQNSAMIRQKMEQYITPVSGVHFGGQAGSDETTLRQALRDLGVTSSESNLDTFIKQIEGGQSSVNDATAQYRTQAAALYPAYASLINQGVNTSDIASPYISRASQLLEQGPGQMNIYNNLIKSALQYSVDGKPTPMPLGAFEQNVRQQPSWLKTDNAQDSMMSTAHKVLMDMGLQF